MPPRFGFPLDDLYDVTNEWRRLFIPPPQVDYSEGQFLVLKTCRPHIFVPEMDIYLGSVLSIKRISSRDVGRFDLEIPPYGTDEGDINRWIFDKDCVNEEKTIILQQLLS